MVEKMARILRGLMHFQGLKTLIYGNILTSVYLN